MSQYIHIFIRHNDDFIHLGEFSRYSYLYETLETYAPWEEIEIITADELDRLISNCALERDNWEKYIAEREAEISNIKDFNNSVDDKRTAILEVNESIKEVKNTILEIQSCIAILDILRWSEKEIYVGMECGSKVTVDDIVCCKELQ